MPIVSAQLWQSLQYGDQDAFVDFLGAHQLWHAQVDHHIRAVGAPPYASLPLGDGPIDDGNDWHLVHQRIHEGECSGLLIAGPPDLTAYDLNRRDDFHTWTWIHALDCLRIQRAAGL